MNNDKIKKIHELCQSHYKTLSEEVDGDIDEFAAVILSILTYFIMKISPDTDSMISNYEIMNARGKEVLIKNIKRLKSNEE